MGDLPSDRLALYNGLHDILGPELADTLMRYIPAIPASEIVTKADTDALADRIDTLADRIDGRIDSLAADVDVRFEKLSQRIDRLSDRMDRLQTTLLGGFSAMVAAVLAAGFLG